MATPEMMNKASEIETQLKEIQWKFSGQRPKASREENWPAPPSINERLNAITGSHWRSTSAVTQTEYEQFTILEEELPSVIEDLRIIAEQDLKQLQEQLDQVGAPWTPGRIPEMKK